MASFGLRSAVQPLLRPLSGGWPGSLQAGFAQPSQAAQGAARATGATCCISAEKMFLRVRVVGWRGEQELRFLFAARVRRAGFPGTDSPRRVDSPAAGGSPSKSCSGRGLAAAPRRLSPRSPRLLALGPGLGVRSQWNSRGRSRGAQAASGRDPSRRVARKPGGNSFFPHSAPRGCRRGKRRRRREDRPRQGEEAPRLVSPSPGRQVRKVPPCGKFGQHGVRQHSTEVVGSTVCLQRAVGGLLSAEARSTHSNCGVFGFLTSMVAEERHRPL
ncbi:hypothetical protein mRhiFer1_008778 [Rhinolophus ferrumequinum]|uniref:Uncharacterized protein n=1 Tax=Rhinolophus ferrumequinum TaxID=59479 RepID=A0A7J7TNA7_RHIFE|nr:uncharacterized protein LOC117012401 isoform X1 [Rhinolophus ferrumequinum]KAF6301870.1 hypothetical protein mRhiFer1_008778 [Rhinolophus ferrumequinum]